MIASPRAVIGPPLRASLGVSALADVPLSIVRWGCAGGVAVEPYTRPGPPPHDKAISAGGFGPPFPFAFMEPGCSGWADCRVGEDIRRGTMTTVNFQVLIEKATGDEEFGSRLIAFAKAHGVEMLSDEELSEDQLDDVAGGISKSMDGAIVRQLDYEPQVLSFDGSQSFTFVRTPIIMD